MMDFINSLIDSYNIPILTAFLLGILTSISPCPLATNITAIAYISKEIKTIKHTLLSGLLYTLGRGISYTILAFSKRLSRLSSPGNAVCPGFLSLQRSFVFRRFNTIGFEIK